MTEQQQEGLQTLQQQQQQELTELQDVLAKAEDIPKKIDRLAAAGDVPFREVRHKINDLLNNIGLGFSEEELRKRERKQRENPFMKAMLAGVGIASDVEFLGFELKDLWEDRTAIDSLASDSKELRQVTEATLRGARDSKNFAAAIGQLDYIEEIIRHKYSNAMRLARDDPSSLKEGLDLTDDLFRDLNRIAVDRQIMQRAQITGDASELNARLAYTELEE